MNIKQNHLVESYLINLCNEIQSWLKVIRPKKKRTWYLQYIMIWVQRCFQDDLLPLVLSALIVCKPSWNLHKIYSKVVGPSVRKLSLYQRSWCFSWAKMVMMVIGSVWFLLYFPKGVQVKYSILSGLFLLEMSSVFFFIKGICQNKFLAEMVQELGIEPANCISASCLNTLCYQVLLVTTFLKDHVLQIIKNILDAYRGLLMSLPILYHVQIF